jgi:hypothetical protein
MPSAIPSASPTFQPTAALTSSPSGQPSCNPPPIPSSFPSAVPSANPSLSPTVAQQVAEASINGQQSIEGVDVADMSTPDAMAAFSDSILRLAGNPPGMKVTITDTTSTTTSTTRRLSFKLSSSSVSISYLMIFSVGNDSMSIAALTDQVTALANSIKNDLATKISTGEWQTAWVTVLDLYALKNTSLASATSSVIILSEPSVTYTTKSPTALPTTVPLVSSLSSSSPSSPVGLIAGVTVAGVAVLVAIIGGIYYFSWSKHRVNSASAYNLHSDTGNPPATSTSNPQSIEFVSDSLRNEGDATTNANAGENFAYRRMNSVFNGSWDEYVPSISPTIMKTHEVLHHTHAASPTDASNQGNTNTGVEVKPPDEYDLSV